MFKRIFNLSEKKTQNKKQTPPPTIRRYKKNLSDQIQPEQLNLSDSNKNKNLELKIQDLEIELRNQEFNYFVKLKILEEKYQKEINQLQKQIQDLKKSSQNQKLLRSGSHDKFINSNQNENQKQRRNTCFRAEDQQSEMLKVQKVDVSDLENSQSPQKIIKKQNESRKYQENFQITKLNQPSPQNIKKEEIKEKGVINKIQNICDNIQKFQSIIEKFNFQSETIQKQMEDNESNYDLYYEQNNNQDQEKDTMIQKLNEQLRQKDLKISKHKNFILQIKQQLVKVMQEKAS